MQAKLAMHAGLVKHLANGCEHCEITHLPTDAGSDTANAGDELRPTTAARAIAAAAIVAAVAAADAAACSGFNSLPILPSAVGEASPALVLRKA